MALRTETREIAGVEVTSTQFPAMRSLRLMTRLGKVLAPLLGGLDGVDLKTLKMTSQIDLSALGRALSAAFVQLAEQDAAQLALDILASSVALVDGRRVELTSTAKIDGVFDGNLKGLLGAIRFAVEVNYGDFFSGAAPDADTPSSPEESPSS